MVRSRHELDEVQQETLCKAPLKGIAAGERVMHIVGAVEQKANKQAPQISAECLTSHQSQVPVASFHAVCMQHTQASCNHAMQRHGKQASLCRNKSACDPEQHASAAMPVASIAPY